MNLSLTNLAITHIIGNRFRSGIILLSAALVTCLAVLSVLIIRGAQASLQMNLQRLGADIIVMPWGTFIEETDSAARFVAFQTTKWLPQAYQKKIASVPGVKAMSPQLYIATITDTGGKAVFLIAIDPQTDFTVSPWMETKTASGLGIDEVIAGSQVAAPESGTVTLFQQAMQVVHRLAPTGTDLDTSLFVSFDTASRLDGRQHEGSSLRGRPFDLVPEAASAFMLRVSDGSNPHTVAARILSDVPGVLPIETVKYFQEQRRQMVGMVRTMVAILVLTLGLCAAFIALIFSLSVNERRRETGVLMALGATDRYIFRGMLLEGLFLAFAGGVAGMAAAVLIITGFQAQLASAIELSAHIPEPQEWLLLTLGGLVLAWITVLAGIYTPSARIAREDIAMIMRE